MTIAGLLTCVEPGDLAVIVALLGVLMWAVYLLGCVNGHAAEAAERERAGRQGD